MLPQAPQPPHLRTKAAGRRLQGAGPIDHRGARNLVLSQHVCGCELAVGIFLGLGTATLLSARGADVSISAQAGHGRAAQPVPGDTETVGPYPKDPRHAARWERGADLIHAFRLHYGITSLDGHPLGQTSGDAQRRRERRVAQERLARLQRQLQHDRIQADRELEIDR